MYISSASKTAKMVLAMVLALVLSISSLANPALINSAAAAEAGTSLGARIPIAPPAVEGSIIRLYQAAFDRAPDDAGLNHWVWRYTQGESLDQIALQFTMSEEFAVVYGQLDDNGFIDRLYLNVLGRSGDAGGIVFWRQIMADGAARAQVLLGFAGSTENTSRTGTPPPVAPRPTIGTDVQEAAIVRLYQAAFLRAPDDAGLDLWVRLLRSGVPLSSIAASFIASQEFANRYGPLDDPTFVDRMYNNVLGREPDAAGRLTWIDVAHAEGRSAVLDGLAQSVEFADRTRTPYWVATMPTSVPLSVLIIGDSVLEGLRLSNVEFGAQLTVFDTAVSRQMSHLPSRLELARSAGRLADAVVIHLGSNGWSDSYDATLLAQLDTLTDHRVLLVDVAVDRSWTEQANVDIRRAADLYSNVIFVEWSVALETSDWLHTDRVHPSAEGRVALANLIAAALVEPL